MSFCREERGRTDRRTDARTDGRTESATDQIFDLARKMDMDGHEWGKKFERCAGSQSCSSTISMKQPSSLPLPSTSLLSPPLLLSAMRLRRGEQKHTLGGGASDDGRGERREAGEGGGASDDEPSFEERAAPRRRLAGRQNADVRSPPPQWSGQTSGR